MPVAFDLRDPERSGVARAAVNIARTFLRLFGDELRISLAGPLPQLEKLDVRAWGPVHQLIQWPAQRYSVLGGWAAANAAAAGATWYFPNWDVPLPALRHPFVATINDLAHLQLPEHSGIKRVVARQWISRTLRSGRRVTCISQYTMRQVAAEWPDSAAKLSVVPLAVDSSFSMDAGPLPAWLAARLQDASYMLSVGIRKERKNLGVGVEVLKAHPALRWIVVGEMFPEWNHVEAAARDAGVLDRMVVLDRQDESVLRALYASAAFLLFPSRYEGFGLPILEALASGTPVIASRSTSIPEVLGDAGWLCDANDPTSFAHAATEVLALGARRSAIVERGRARAREFTWERTARGIADALQAAAS